MENIFKKQFFILLCLLIFVPVMTRADNVGQQQNFFVDPGYTSTTKTQISATLVRNSDKAYFYIDNDWLNQRTEKEKESLYSVLSTLGKEFDSNIYAQLTSVFGSEAMPGIDRDTRVTILLHSMKENTRGYIRTVDGYEKIVNPLSNQREMIYLNIDNLTNPLMKSFLAHEFMHLITLNQKDLMRGVSEQVWLNEARAEYAVTLLGYNNETDSSYLANREKLFIDNSSDSLVIWNKTTADYGVTSIFIHYLVDQYGLPVLTNSLKSKQVGIASLNEAIIGISSQNNFNTAFTNFTIAAYLNDCTLSSAYCFKDKNLKDFHVLAFSNFLPFSGESNLNLGQNLKNYSAHWQKFSGGTGNLKIVFKNQSAGKFSVPYILKNVDGTSVVKFLKIDSTKTGELIVPNINQDVISVIMIPSLQIQDSNSTADYSYSITASSFVDNGIDSEDNVDNNSDNNNDSNIDLPFTTDKPLNQMNREELLIVILRLIINLILQGRTLPLSALT